jgi:hypothetical protein
MSQESVEHFLGRIITDDAFRRMALGSMRLAIAAEDFTFTHEEIEALTLIDGNVIELVSRELDKAIKRSSASQNPFNSVANDTVLAVGGSR